MRRSGGEKKVIQEEEYKTEGTCEGPSGEPAKRYSNQEHWLAKEDEST